MERGREEGGLLLKAGCWGDFREVRGRTERTGQRKGIAKLLSSHLWDRHCLKYHKVLSSFSFYKEESRNTARVKYWAQGYIDGKRQSWDPDSLVGLPKLIKHPAGVVMKQRGGNGTRPRPGMHWSEEGKVKGPCWVSLQVTATEAGNETGSLWVWL